MSDLAICLQPPAKTPGFNFLLKPIVCWTHRMLEEDTNKAGGVMEKHTGLDVQGVTTVSLPLMTSHMLSTAAYFSIFFPQ